MSQRYFLTAESTYEDLRVSLNAQLQYPNALGKTVFQTSLQAPRDSFRRVLLAVDTDLAGYATIASAIQPLLDSDAMEELDQAAYLAAVASATEGVADWSQLTGKPTTLAGYGITDAAAASHSHHADDITSGTVATARLGSGTASSGTWLRGDQTWQSLPTSGTKTYAVFTPRNNQPPSTNFATLDTRNSIAVLDFDDATKESAIFPAIIPEGASLGSGLVIRILWMAASATSNACRWEVSLERGNTDLDSDSFDTVATAATTTNGTSGIVSTTEITLTTIDSVAAGELYRLRVARDATNAADTMTGDAQLVAVEVRVA